MIWLGWTQLQSDWCLYKKRKCGHTKRHQGCKPTEERPCEDMVRRQPSSREKPQKKPNLPSPGSCTSKPPECEKIHFCCLSHPPCLLHFVMAAQADNAGYFVEFVSGKWELRHVVMRQNWAGRE